MSRARGKLPRIFLSHAGRDAPFAARIATLLRAARLHVWYSPHAIAGAAQWHDEIGAALERCNWLVVVLSPAAVRSPWVKRELMYALRTPRYANHIVPLLWKPCDVERLSWTLPDFQMVDFTEDFSQGRASLLRIWKR